MISGFFKAILGSFIGALALIAFFVLLLPSLIPQDTYKEYLSRTLSRATGMNVQVNGDVRIGMLPDVTVFIQNIVLSKPDGFSTHIPHLWLQIDVLPLFANEVHLNARTQFNKRTITSRLYMEELHRFLKGHAVPLSASLNVDAPVTINGMFSWGKGHIALTQGTLDLDGTLATTALTLDYAKPVPMLTLDAGFNILDIQKLLRTKDTILTALSLPAHIQDAPQSSSRAMFTPAVEKPEPSGGSSGGALLDLSALKTLDAVIKVNVDTLIVQEKMRVYQSLLSASLREGKLDGTLSSTSFFGGKSSIDATVQQTNGQAMLTLTALIENMQMESLLDAVMGTRVLRGLAFSELQVVSSGKTVEEFKDQLQGSGWLTLSSGVLRNINLQALQNPATLLQNIANPQSSDTPVSMLSSSFALRNGLITNNDLMIDTPPAVIQGTGHVNIWDQTIRYQLLPALKLSEGSTATAIPVNVTGYITAPKFRVDVGKAVMEHILQPERLGKIEELKTFEQMKDNFRNLDEVLKDKNTQKKLIEGIFNSITR